MTKTAISIVAMAPDELHLTIGAGETLFAGFAKFESAETAEGFKRALVEGAGNPLSVCFCRHADFQRANRGER